MAVAMQRGQRYVVLGAPRYKHRGQVVVHRQYQTQKLNSGQVTLPLSEKPSVNQSVALLFKVMYCHKFNITDRIANR